MQQNRGAGSYAGSPCRGKSKWEMQQGIKKDINLICD
jgi:hypothetical protein